MIDATSVLTALMSLPVRGAWVEMGLTAHMASGGKSLPVRGAWVEMRTSFWDVPMMLMSLPVRGAWVEILR